MQGETNPYLDHADVIRGFPLPELLCNGAVWVNDAVQSHQVTCIRQPAGQINDNNEDMANTLSAPSLNQPKVMSAAGVGITQW